MQVLPAGQPKQSFGQKLNQGVGRSLDIFSQQIQSRKQDQALSEITGMDVSGLPPEMKQAVLVEALKQQGKNQLQSQKQSFLDSLFGGGQQQEQSPQDMMPEQQGMESFDQGQMGQQGQMQRQGGFDPSKVSDADIARAASIDPVLGRELRAAKDTGLREKRLEEERSPEYQRGKLLTTEQAKADVKYNQELQSSSKLNKIKADTLDKLDKLNKKGVTGKPYEKLLEKSGLFNLTSEGRREFAADVKNLITDIRSILGGQFSQFEFQTILNAYPSADFSKEANDAIIRNLKEFQDIRNKEFEIASDLKKKNGGRPPEDFQSQVNERVQEYAASKKDEIKKNMQDVMNAQYGVPKGFTLLLDPNGDPLSVPDEEVEMLLQNGAERP
jgi:hypothetical protein